MLIFLASSYCKNILIETHHLRLIIFLHKFQLGPILEYWDSAYQKVLATPLDETKNEFAIFILNEETYIQIKIEKIVSWLDELE